MKDVNLYCVAKKSDIEALKRYIVGGVLWISFLLGITCGICRADAPNIRPYDYNKYGFRVSGQYGEGRINKITGEKRKHNGIDYKLEEGTKVFNTCDGFVEYAGDYYGYGLAVIISSSQSVTANCKDKIINIPEYKIFFAHLQKQKVLEEWKINKGELIGLSGRSGGVPPHLHYEVRKVMFLNKKRTMWWYMPVFPFIK